MLRVGGAEAQPNLPPTVPPFSPKEEPPAAPRLTEQLAKFVSSGQGSRQGPPGLRHHSCSVVGPFAVLFGGEALNRARDTVCNDLYIYDARETRLVAEEGKVGRGESGGARSSWQVKGTHRILNLEEACQLSEEKKTGKPVVLEVPKPPSALPNRQVSSFVVPLRLCRPRAETHRPSDLPLE